MKRLSLQPRARVRLPVAVLAVFSAVGALLVALLAPAQPAQAVRLAPTAASITCATSRPPNGTILYAGISGGPGRLTIVNGLSQDGVVALVRGSSKAISVYVRAKSSATVRNIRDGTYTIYFTTGSLFSVCTGRFNRGAAYWRFNDRLPFVPLPGYTVATLTLQAVPGGNAPVSQINPGDFPPNSGPPGSHRSGRNDSVVVPEVCYLRAFGAGVDDLAWMRRTGGERCFPVAR